MRKITKKSLDELAKIMPPLSVEEQRSCIAGSGTALYVVDSNGYVTKFLDTSIFSFLPYFSGDTIIDSSGNNSISIPTGIISNPVNTSEYTMYTGNIPKELFEFMARNTVVEWSYVTINNRGFAALATSNTVDLVNFAQVQGATGSYHNHDGSEDESYLPSEDDIKWRYTTCKNYIYHEQSNTYILY